MEDATETGTTSRDDSSEVDSEFSEASSSNLEHDQKAAPTARFNGKWSKAHIFNGVLTWTEGEDVTIEIISETTFQMHYVGTNLRATLQEDGHLHWDDGDVWCRSKTDFEGFWAQASIQGNMLKWNEGESISIFPLSANTFQMQYFCNVPPYSEQVYHAELKQDGRLHWDDGDIWTRKEFPSRRTLPADVCKVAQAAVKPPSSGKSSQEVKASSEKPSFAAIVACPQVLRHVCKGVADTLPQDRAPWQETLTADNCNRRQKAAVVLKPADSKVYQGVVKWFRGSYGWIVCEKAGADKDIMVHKNDCDFKPKQGDEVRFQLASNARGNLQALKVRRAPSTIDAKDWFRAQTAERSKLLSSK